VTATGILNFDNAGVALAGDDLADIHEGRDPRCRGYVVPIPAGSLQCADATLK
jgi:hypothetical protein